MRAFVLGVCLVGFLQRQERTLFGVTMGRRTFEERSDTSSLHWEGDLARKVGAILGVRT